MLRSYQLTDLKTLLSIERIAQITPWSEAIFKHCITRPEDCWVIEEDKQVVGFIIIAYVVNEIHILNLCVHPDYQQRGHGRQLLNHVLNKAKREQIAMAYLEVRCSNQPAIRLYDKLGFVQIGERKNYYPTPTGYENALIFAKELSIDAHLV